MGVGWVNLPPPEDPTYLSSPVESYMPCSCESCTPSQPWTNVQCLAPTQPGILHARSEVSPSTHKFSFELTAVRLQIYLVSGTPPMRPISTPRISERPISAISPNEDVALRVDASEIFSSTCSDTEPTDSLAYATCRYQWPKV
jgi:hypothetical protein